MPPCRSSLAGRIAALAAAGALCAASSPAAAVDWQLLYRLSETLRINDDIVRDDPEDSDATSTTSGSLEIRAVTPRSQWSAAGTLGYLAYFGEAAPEPRTRTTTSAKSDFLTRTRDTDYFVNAQFSIAPARRFELIEPFPGLPTDPTDPEPDPDIPVDPIPEVPSDLPELEREILRFDRISYGASAGLSHRRTRSDTFGLRAYANRVDFTGDSAEAKPHTNLGLSGSWSRTLTRRLNGRANVSVAYYRPDDENEGQRVIYDVGIGGRLLLNPRVTLSADLGVNIIDQNRASALAAGAPQRSDVSIGPTGSASLTYTPTRDLTLSLAWSQQTAPDGLGDLRNSQSVSGLVSHQINELSSVSLSGAFRTSTPTGDDTDSRQVWTVSPRYVHTLARNWNLSIAYQWSRIDDGATITQSNAGFLTLSHSGTILP